MSSTITPARFITKWHGTELKERSAAQEHFIDLCYLLGVPTPAEADRTGAYYTFEKGAAKSGGGDGFADVWYQGHFAWEYKTPGRSLDDAYQQLLQYHEALENPPLLVVCDLETFRIHTKFENTVTVVHEFTIDQIDREEHLSKLRALFLDPDRLRPQRTVQQVTEEAAERFANITLGLRDRGADPDQTAHFMVQLLFCLFAEDVGLLPNRVFTRLARFSADNPAHFPRAIEELLVAMRDGGMAGWEPIKHFNGGLFNEIHVLELTQAELRELERASRLDWSSIEPAIIGTLFERSLDPARRSQLGAHYTGRGDIERVVEPVVMTPLRRRWAEVRARDLNDLRERWLNPEDATEAELKKRTLTNLYNQRPTWLANAHKKLDRAVLTAYGWSDLIPTLVDDQSPVTGPPSPEALTTRHPEPHSRHPEPVEGSPPSPDPDSTNPVTGNLSPVPSDSPSPVTSPEEELLARLLALNLERASREQIRNGTKSEPNHK